MIITREKEDTGVARSPENELLFHYSTDKYVDNRINPFPNKPWFLRVCSISVLKTLWGKEKLLVTSNFSFSRSVFYMFLEFSAISIKFEIVVC